MTDLEQLLSILLFGCALLFLIVWVVYIKSDLEEDRKREFEDKVIKLIDSWAPGVRNEKQSYCGMFGEYSGLSFEQRVRKIVQEVLKEEKLKIDDTGAHKLIYSDPAKFIDHVLSSKRKKRREK